MTHLAFPIQLLLCMLSLCIVGFGQPLWGNWISLAAACFGYALFWRVLISVPRTWDRFWMGFAWFALVQMIQVYWMASHPFFYIYIVIIFLGFVGGIQFGIISCLISPSRCLQIPQLFAIAGLWVLLEWSRLFILSGLSFNPAGMAFSGNLYSLQLASVGGVFLLSFLVFLINLFVLRAWLLGFTKTALAWPLVFAVLPFLFGVVHYHFHLSKKASAKEISVLLLQTAFPVEEMMPFHTAEEMRAFVLGEWLQILHLTAPYQSSSVDLTVLPEFVVPYGAYYPVYPYVDARFLFEKAFKDSAKTHLAPLEEPFAYLIETKRGQEYWVSNAFFAQSLANILHTDLVVGLEDSVYVDEEQKQAETYSSAFHFAPAMMDATRYDKRVLVPMGEYIPFDCLKNLAKSYGVGGSFTPGTKAVVCKGSVPFGFSICYEETFSQIIRDNRLSGAELLVNLTNDGWYPNSALPQQHFDHARFRTVENGFPVVRACNTGITGAYSSLGEVVDYFGNDFYDSQTKQGAFFVKVPTYHYHTLYTFWGDSMILGFSCLALGYGLFTNKKHLR